MTYCPECSPLSAGPAVQHRENAPALFSRYFLRHLRVKVAFSSRKTDPAIVERPPAEWQRGGGHNANWAFFLRPVVERHAVREWRKADRSPECSTKMMIPGDSPSRYPPMKGSYSFSHSSDARNSRWIVSEHGCSRSHPPNNLISRKVSDPSQVW